MALRVEQLQLLGWLVRRNHGVSMKRMPRHRLGNLGKAIHGCYVDGQFDMNRMTLSLSSAGAVTLIPIGIGAAQ